MPRRTQTPPTQDTPTEGVQQYVRLENRLVLLAWLNSLLGYKSNRDLLEDCKKSGEGFDADGKSFLLRRIVSRGDLVQIPVDDLERYDENIRQHLEKINRKRREKITLRYFQHLAALYTEIVLDRLFRNEEKLLNDLNAFVRKHNPQGLHGEPEYKPFTKDDLTKLAFWMATGSGKTLLMHLNYHQFLHYNRQPIDNILLITPNEGLSEQHLRELEASGIPAWHLSPNGGGLWSGAKDGVQVIEITKLVEEKDDGGVRIPVEAFEGRNLIFVDEGHKGTGGEAWRKYREALGKNGFTFEYSATFGQALSAAKNDELTAEYAKAIVFDYSYKYFHGDGFGKDFRVLNLTEDTDQEKTDILLLGNLLTFYEQLLLYEEKREELRPYNLEKPLWVFVGGTVNAVYTEQEKPRSDVLTVVRFLHRVLSDHKWAKDTLPSILDGNTGLVSADGADIFADRFPFLKKKSLTAEGIYRDILQRVFHTSTGGGLHLYHIQSSAGEIGLRAANGEGYFGVIYIGDPAKFKKLVKEEASHINLEQDAITSSSLFEGINTPNSRIHVLIGARKFMEGWNSWRVSSMGLLNIGKKEGPQIIQLFGRGVRLKGKDLSLKRSAALPGNHPDHIHLLETLNIFAVRANYMADFRSYLEREGVEVEPTTEIRLPVRVQEGFLNDKLLVPRLPEGKKFDEVRLLEPDTSLSVVLDLSVRVQVIDSNQQSARQGTGTKKTSSRQPQPLPKEKLDWMDWNRVYLEVLEYKARKGFSNLVIRPEVLQQIVEAKDANGKAICAVIAEEDVIFPQKFGEREKLQQVVVRLLCKYVDKFYQKCREQWEEDNLEYGNLNSDDSNLTFNPDPRDGKPTYVLRIPSSKQDVIKEVESLVQQLDQLQGYSPCEVMDGASQPLPRIYFDQHIYLPLLLEGRGISISPPGLNEGEKEFVKDLCQYWQKEKDQTLKGKTIYLLRNLSHGRGIGFFEGRGFYPDFILWVVDPQKKHQRIVFVEPHGMLYAKAYEHDEKARLWEKLRSLDIKGDTCEFNVSLDAYIISVTPFEELKVRYGDGKWDLEKFAKHHILFFKKTKDTEDTEYIKRLLSEKED